ncbi:MAG TPA: translation elongation factor Ts [Actinomycetota bacterium]
MEIKAADVKVLRDATGAGMMECKKALTEAGGDMEKAKTILRERGLASAKKLAERAAGEGIVEAYLHQPDPTLPPKVGVMLELNCATDFVAKTEQFRVLARNIALHIAATRPDYLSREEVAEEDVARERELAAKAAEGKPENVVEKIVEGKLNDWYKDRVLLDQIYIRDEAGKMTIAEMLDHAAGDLKEPIRIRRFARFRVGGE